MAITMSCNDCGAEIVAEVPEALAWDKTHPGHCPGPAARLMEQRTDASGGLPIRTA